MLQAIQLFIRALKILNKSKVSRTFIKSKLGDTRKVIATLRTQKGSITILKKINALTDEEKKELFKYFNASLPSSKQKYYNSQMVKALELADIVPNQAFSPYQRKKTNFAKFKDSNRKGLPSNKAKTQITQKTLKENESFKNDTTNISENSNFSSSWLVKGFYVKQFQTNGVVFGSLTLTMKGSTKQYTYYDVPFVTYLLMKQARGMYGTGAGSVFWKTYLRGNFPIQSEKRINKAIRTIEKRREREVTFAYKKAKTQRTLQKNTFQKYLKRKGI